jgi:hypothetical protein
MIEIMLDISADIDVPIEHVSIGRTYASAGHGPDPVAAAQIKIHSGTRVPSDAFAKVRYRDSWYWISDGDLLSKRSLTLLLLFFSLAETGVVPAAPVLTIPVQ